MLKHDGSSTWNATEHHLRPVPAPLVHTLIRILREKERLRATRCRWQPRAQLLISISSIWRCWQTGRIDPLLGTAVGVSCFHLRAAKSILSASYRLFQQKIRSCYFEYHPESVLTVYMLPNLIGVMWILKITFHPFCNHSFSGMINSMRWVNLQYL